MILHVDKLLTLDAVRETRKASRTNIYGTLCFNVTPMKILLCYEKDFKLFIAHWVEILKMSHTSVANYPLKSVVCLL